MGKTVLVNYFAFLREQRGLASEHCCTQAITVGQFYDELQLKYGFTLARANLRVSKNNEFCPWEAALKEGDKIVFIPPVAGG